MRSGRATGWFPASLLASEIGLLVFLAWLLAFGTHDLIHALQRSRAALGGCAAAPARDQSATRAEMQQRLNLQETFDHARFHDAFTGLPNRRYFMDQLDRALRDVRTKRRQRIAVIIVDIARFKLINDMLGHTAGDELMVQAARRFEKSTSAFEGVLARWGGDQFAVLILDIASSEAALKLPAFCRSELRSPFELRRHRLVVAATFGITCADSGQQRAEDVVREADIALSVAKRQEPRKSPLYARTWRGRPRTSSAWRRTCTSRLEKHELQLLFQPIVDLRTYTMVGAEALLRWRHPVESVLAPEQFPSHRGRSRIDGPDHPLDHSQGGQDRSGMAAAPARQSKVLHQRQSFRDRLARSGAERIHCLGSGSESSCRRRCSSSS